MDSLGIRLDLFLRKKPRYGKRVYVARGAVVVGDVELGENSSVWYNAVLRADINRIVVGHHTNIQDNAVFHLEDDTPCRVGNYVTVGHSAILHACTVKDETLIGMGAVILNHAEIGRECLVGARALVLEGTKIPDGSLVVGMPAKVVRALSPEERRKLKRPAEKYARIAAYCLRHGINVSDVPQQRGKKSG